MADTDTPVHELATPYLNKWGSYQFTRDEIDASKIRYFCEVAEDANPMYWDEEFASKSRFGRLIAPPQGLRTFTFGSFWQPDYVRDRTRDDAARLSGESPSSDSDAGAQMGGVMGLARERGYDTVTVTSTEAEYLSPFGPNEGRIKQRTMTTQVSEEKQTRVGRGIFITNITEYRTENDDRLIGRLTMVLLNYRPKSSEDEG